MSPSPVDWDLARRVAGKASGSEPFSESYLAPRLHEDFAEFTALAEELVTETTGLAPLTGSARAAVIDRPEWVDVNVRAFRSLLAPLTDKLGEQMGSGPLTPVARRVAGAELGVVLGWMSKRVLGQYDLLIVDDDSDASGNEDGESAGDVVYYVGPNVLALEKRWGFPPREFRLWLALHEVTHRAQFTGVPWMREHFLGLVQSMMDEVDADPDRFMASIKRVVEMRRSGGDPLAEGGLSAIFATESQRETMDQIGGLMSLLEGHGDVTMGRAGGDLVPSSERFHRVLHERRKQAGRGAKLIQRLIGLEAKMAQYEQGENFLHAIEADHGPRAIDRAWERPEHLPNLAEIREPRQWIERVLATPAQV